MSYGRLLSPIRLGSLELPNRLVMGSMHTGLEDDRADIPALAAYFAERARGGVGLIITGAYAVNRSGRLKEGAADLTTPDQADQHRRVTDAVHAAGGRIVLQLIHAGRYAFHDENVGASAKQSPITPFQPRALSTEEVDQTVEDFAAAAGLAKAAGYDGVEVMGCEGYLINQFLAPRTNDRTDCWGGSAANRMRFPTEIIRRIRAQVGGDYPVLYRISLADLVEDGQTWSETVQLAHALEEAGVSAFDSGIGWHEARVPTILTQVPRGAWTTYTARLKAAVSVPVCASTRINTPELAEEVIASGAADLVALARPLLADPDFARKAAADRAREINTCIACNQACLDHGFLGLKATCLVNPRACQETTLLIRPTRRPKTVAVVGAGPAGLAASLTAAERGLDVTLFEQASQVGGQFRLAMKVPGKEDFAETLRYFSTRLGSLGVDLRLNSAPSPDALESFDEIIVATGVTPRIPELPGIDHPSVVSYADVLSGRATPGGRVAVIGAGGIGVDVSHWLTHDGDETLADWMARWGVDATFTEPGGLTTPTPRHVFRHVTLLQRKPTPIGIGLGKTSGWAHRAVLGQAGVEFVPGASYDLIDDAGLHVTFDGESSVLPVDTIVVCAGQESVRALYDDLCLRGRTPHLIGGADVAAELDAKRAIAQGTEVAAGL